MKKDQNFSELQSSSDVSHSGSSGISITRTNEQNRQLDINSGQGGLGLNVEASSQKGYYEIWF